MTIQHHANLPQANALRYRLETLRGGRVVDSRQWREHMITDAGLEALATQFGLDLIVVPIIGDAASPTPVRRDGGAIRFSQTGDIVTTDGSVAFFTAADVGRLLKFGSGTDGQECYVAEYLSAASVRVDRSATVTSDAAVVWYVNTAALLSPIAGLSWSVVSGGAYNYTQGTVYGDVVTITHQTTRLSSVFTGAKTITEIAFTGNGMNASVFDRDVIQPGAGVLAGDQVRVTVQLIYRVTGVTPVSVPNFGTGCDTSGTAALVSAGLDFQFNGFGGFNADGSAYIGSLDPASTRGSLKAITQDFAFPGFSMGNPGNLPGVNVAVAVAPYVSGSLVRDVSASYGTEQANATIYGMSFAGSNNDMYVLKLATPFAKTALQTFALVFRKSIRRLLNN